MTHFADSGFGFDYPAEWHVIAENGFNGADQIPIVVGTGDWAGGCVTVGSMTNCGASVFTADPGEVVAEFSYRIMGPASPVYDVPPFDAWILAEGAAAEVIEGAQSTRAVIYVPGRRSYTMDIRWGSPPSEADRAVADLIIDSFVFRGQRSDLSLRSWDPASIGSSTCARIEIQGRIGRGDFGGLNVTTEIAFAFISWPMGWRAQTGDGGRAELLDSSGRVVAREWDEVRIGGRGDNNEFRACPDEVAVVRTFPSE